MAKSGKKERRVVSTSGSSVKKDATLATPKRQELSGQAIREKLAAQRGALEKAQAARRAKTVSKQSADGCSAQIENTMNRYRQKVLVWCEGHPSMVSFLSEMLEDGSFEKSYNLQMNKQVMGSQNNLASKIGPKV